MFLNFPLSQEILPENKMKKIILMLILLLPLSIFSKEPQTRSEIINERLKWQNFVRRRWDSLGERHLQRHWHIPAGEKPNLSYRDGFEVTQERYIDNKDRHDLEKAYLERARTQNFYLSDAYLKFISQAEIMSLQKLRKLARKTRWRQFRTCHTARARLAVQSTIDALPLAAGIQAELWDIIVDQNTHSPESGLAGIAGGALGSMIEGVDRAYHNIRGEDDEFDGGLWAVTRLVWNETFGLNSQCFIESRKIELLRVLLHEKGFSQF